jgi:PGF-CTERM protein
VRAIVSNSNASQTYAVANISTPDPGRTSINVNTYALGNESLTDSAITAGPGATVESVETSLPNTTLSPGTYRVAVRSEQGLAATSDEASVTVESRSTNGMRVYSTTELKREDLKSARAVRRAIDEGTLSRTETVRAGETVVYAVNGTGLTGLPAARDATVETGRDLARLDGLAFGVRSNESAVATATGDVESVPTNATVHLDERGLFVVGRGIDALAANEAPTDRETFTAEFRVEDERLRAATSDSTDDHDVSATVTFEGATSPEDDGEPSGEGDSLGGGDAGGSGGSGAGGPGRSGGGESATAPAGDAPTSGPAAEGERGGSGEPARLGLRRAGSRTEIRPAADVRGVASDDSAVPPAGASVWTGPAGARSDRSGSSAGSSGDSSPSEATGTAVPSDDEGESTAANGGASEGDATEAPSTGRDATDAEAPTPSYDDAPIRATAEDVPGFGPPATVVALLLAGGLGARRRGS